MATCPLASDNHLELAHHVINVTVRLLLHQCHLTRCLCRQLYLWWRGYGLDALLDGLKHVRRAVGVLSLSLVPLPFSPPYRRQPPSGGWPPRPPPRGRASFC